MSLPVRSHLEAAAVGYERQRRAVLRDGTPRHRNGSLWGGSIESACAEQLVAGWLAKPWTGAALWDVPPAEPVPDVGERTEVRWVAPGPSPTLYLDALRDKPDSFYVLVTGFAPDLRIVGYVRGEAGMRPQWRHRFPEREVFRVPASALRYLPPG